VAWAIALNMRPQNSWRVTLENGELTWATNRGGSAIETHREPDTPWWRRTQSGFIAMLPVEKYL
jgi:putative cardiolipin synthase